MHKVLFCGFLMCGAGFRHAPCVTVVTFLSRFSRYESVTREEKRRRKHKTQNQKTKNARARGRRITVLHCPVDLRLPRKL